MHPTDPTISTSDAGLPPALDPLFAPLRAELATVNTPDAVHQHLLSALRRQQQQSTSHAPWWRRLGASGWGLAGCGASGVLALALLLVVLVHPPHPGALPASADSNVDEDNAFIALDTLDQIAGEPAPRVLATRVPRASLVALGLTVSPQEAGDMVQADMLVGGDGRPLALRLAAE